MAAAISVALHEIAAGVIPPNQSRSAAPEIVSSARVLRITREVRPSPSIPPPPQPIVIPQPSPPPRRAAPAAAQAIALHAVQRPLVRLAAAKRASDARPVWDVATGPAQNGVTTASAGAAAGASAGASHASGDAPPGGEQPCGFVTFSDPHGSHYDPQTRGFWVDIRMSVHFADGSAQSLILDYPWYYPSEAANPWSDHNVRDPSFPTRFQTPPAAKIAAEPELVKYVAQHSTPDGMTLLRDCPSAAAPSR